MFIEQVKRVDWMDYAMLEMSVIPIPHESKKPDYRWSRLRWVKLHPLMDDAKGQRTLQGLYDLGGGGLAVLCGHPSENLFVIDCDTLDSLNECRRQLWARGFDAPCVYSSRGGHIYLRAREGAVKTVAAGVMQDVEIRGDGAIAVLPPTKHASGITYTWSTGQPPRRIPTVSIDDMNFLIGKDGKPIKLAVATKSERRLHDDTRAYLATGQRLVEGTRNERLFMAARDYKYVNKDSSTALHDLLPIALKSGLSEKEATATILSPFKSSARRKKAFNQTDELTAFMLGAAWGRGTGKTDKRVFEAMIQRRGAEAYRRKDGVFRASLREIATLARFDSLDTIRASLKRLVDAGYIEFVGRDSESIAHLYRMTDMVMGAGKFFLVHNQYIKQQVSSRSDYCTTLAQLAEKSALGHTANLILNLLKRNLGTTPWADSSVIADQVGVHRTTAGRNLDKLVALGLVEKVSGEYRAIAVTPAEEIALVVSSGAYAAAQAREARFNRDRAYFALNAITEYLWNKNQEGKSS